MGQLCCRPQTHSKNSPCSSKTYISSLPDEIITDILSRLPEKSVKACKSVCLSWNRLSATPHFTEMHLYRGRPVILAQADLRRNGIHVVKVFGENEWCKEVSLEGMKTLWNNDYNRLYASCNGILLFRSMNGYVICNPVTRERLTFEFQAGVVFGFFFHKLEKEYKLLLSHGGYSLNSYSFYSLTTKEMRNLRTPGIFPLADNAPAVAAYGALFWRVYSLSLNDNGIVVESNAIMMLDIDTETFQELPQPTSRFTHGSVKLLEVDGKLSCCNVCENVVEVWNLEDHERRGWVKRFVVNLGSYSSCRPRCNVLGILRGTLLLHCHRGLLWCNLRKNNTVSEAKTVIGFGFLYATKYTSSFVSLQESKIF